MSLPETLTSALNKRSAIPPAPARRERGDRLLYWCACAVTALTASMAILAVAIAAVVLDSVAADHGRAEQLLYQALRTVISEAPPPRRSTHARRRSDAHQRDL